MPLIREFAIEPEALGEWSIFRYLFEKLGFPEARLGLRLPADWARQVLAACKDELDRKRIEELLRRHYDSRVVAPPLLGGAKPNGWIAAVGAVHARRALAGIVVRTRGSIGPPDVPVVTTDELSDDFLYARRELSVPATAQALAEVARDLLRLSSRVLLIDPHFTVTSPGWRDTFCEIVSTARREDCEYVDVLTTEARCPKSPAGTLSDFLEKAIGPKQKPRIEIRFLGPSARGDRLHHRFLLSQVGAIRYDRGFEALGANVSADVGIVDRERHAELVERYVMGRHDFPVTFTLNWPVARGSRMGPSVPSWDSGARSHGGRAR